MSLARYALLPALLLVLALPSAAAAVESTGRGEGISHVRNIPYPNLHAPEEQNAGTDLEFATITLPGTVPGPASAAGAKPKGRKAAAARRERLRSRDGFVRRCRTVRTRRGNRRQCRVVRRRAAKPRRKRRLDARLDLPGIQRTLSFAGSYGDGLHVIDVTDPENATRVATWDCGISQGDVQVFQRADLGGRWFVTFTHDDGYDFHADSQCAKDLAALGFDPKAVEGGGTYIADVTDPYAPKTVSFVPILEGSHNQTVHPSGRYLYNSNSDLITSVLPAVEIIDISDIGHPRKVGEIALKTFPGLGTESHDIGFSEDGRRAYVAALSHGEILDTTDPAKPTSIGTIIDPAINVWHETEAIHIKDPIMGERDFLIAEDEVAGALGTGQCPNGGVHVYDITGDRERAPVKVGAWNIDDVGLTESTLGTCTAHVFQLHRAAQLMTIAYYNGGVRVVDLTGLVGVALGKTGIGMKQVGWFRFPDSDTWAVKAPHVSRNGFYLYGNDHARGFDVYRYRPSAGAAASRGRWLTPEASAAASRRLRTAGTGARLPRLCLINPGKPVEVREAARRANLDF